MNKYIIIISFDAVSSEDLSILETLPNFREIIKNGSLIKNVSSIYPSLTYPAHGTIVTGKYPINHGIIDNTFFRPFEKNPNWYWHRKYIKGDTIYDLAKNIGLKTCSLFWPVTAGANIDYNMPEIFCTKCYHNQLFMSAMAGNLKYQYEINNKFKHIRNGIKEPELDDFTTEALKYTINKYTPNLILVHFIDVDSHRHNYGYSSKEALEGLKRHDRRLGEIIETLKKKEIFDETAIIALGDHSALDVQSSIKLNKFFKDEGLLKVNSKGRIISYKAISKSLDGSAYIYLNKRCNEEIKVKVEKLIAEKLLKYDVIEGVLNKEEIKKIGGDINAHFMVEAKSGFYFIDDTCGEFVEDINLEEIGKVKHRYKATHGYNPNKENYGTFFIGYGKGFKKGVVKENGKLINHGPTIARLLDINMKGCDGEIEYDILDVIR